MTMLILAALAAATAQPAPAPAAPDAQHQQKGMTHDAKDCCCKDMAKDGKMACCAKHGDGKAGEHANHGMSH
ncbi:MAG: hypothetical protein ABIP91_08575 [Sphingomicrobium sp.]